MLAPASSQLSLLRDAALSLGARFRPFRHSPRVTLQITGGMHDAHCSTLQRDVIRVGTGLENDLVLIDPELGERQIKIVLMHSLMGPVAIVSAKGADMAVNGVPLAAGTMSHHVRLPLETTLCDGITLRLGAPERRAPNAIERALKRLLVTTSVLLVGTLGFLALDAADGREYGLHLPDRTTVPAPPGTGRPIGLAEITAKLREVGLDQVITVSHKEDGIFAVTGRLTEAQWQRWQQVAVWYDSAANGRPMVSSLRVGLQFNNPPPIAMVQVSEPRRIILATGQVLSVDDRFSDDWIIAEINPGDIVVRRGNEEEVFAFAERAR